jgi:hypothetical protein
VGNVYAVVDHGGTRENKTIAKGLHRPNGVAFKDQTRADIDGSMTTAAQPLSQQDIENVAHYIANLTPAVVAAVVPER